jgi:hypothetical protein
MARELAAADSGGAPLHAAPDDVATLRAILAHGIGTLQPTRMRNAGPWELQFNPLRTFRPARHSHARIDGLRAPFDAHKFHFDKPYLRQEILWQGLLLGRDAIFFYNKFPFADYQCMLVPELKAHCPQFLETDDLAYLWDLASELGARMPGFGLAYNSYGAHASLPHLPARDAAAHRRRALDAQWRQRTLPLPLHQARPPRRGTRHNRRTAFRQYQLQPRPGWRRALLPAA